MPVQANPRQAKDTALLFYLLADLIVLHFLGGVFFIINMIHYWNNSNSKHLIVLAMYFDIVQSTHIY